MRQEFYQIYYKELPLKGYTYDNCRDARKGLDILFDNLLSTAPLLGYTVKRRIKLQGNILAVTFTYQNGATANRTYVVHRVRTQVVQIASKF